MNGLFNSKDKVYMNSFKKWSIMRSSTTLERFSLLSTSLTWSSKKTPTLKTSGSNTIRCSWWPKIIHRNTTSQPKSLKRWSNSANVSTRTFWVVTCSTTTWRDWWKQFKRKPVQSSCSETRPSVTSTSSTSNTKLTWSTLNLILQETYRLIPLIWLSWSTMRSLENSSEMKTPKYTRRYGLCRRCAQ